jgi:hypothetical protein
MFGYMLQDWVTIQSASTITSVPQTEDGWMSFQKFQDIMFWTDVRAISLGGTTNVALRLETSPTKDESLFLPMVAQFNILPGAGPILTPVRLANATAANPALARWVRWTLVAVGVPSSNWGATFRIACAANAVGGGA